MLTLPNKRDHRLLKDSAPSEATEVSEVDDPAIEWAASSVQTNAPVWAKHSHPRSTDRALSRKTKLIEVDEPYTTSTRRTYQMGLLFDQCGEPGQPDADLK